MERIIIFHQTVKWSLIIQQFFNPKNVSCPCIVSQWKKLINYYSILRGILQLLTRTNMQAMQRNYTRLSISALVRRRLKKFSNLNMNEFMVFQRKPNSGYNVIKISWHSRRNTCRCNCTDPINENFHCSINELLHCTYQALIIRWHRLKQHLPLLAFVIILFLLSSWPP